MIAGTDLRKFLMAGVTGLEPATSGLTVQSSVPYHRHSTADLRVLTKRPLASLKASVTHGNRVRASPLVETYNNSPRLPKDSFLVGNPLILCVHAIAYAT